MAATAAVAETYICPMHADVFRAAPGSCPKCGMPLVVKGRFALLRHMTSNPTHLIVMALLMLAAMAAAMLWLP
jgi:hypothetical protein